MPWPPIWPIAGFLAADQGLGDVAPVAHLADQAIGVQPQAQRSVLARMLEAVREHLVHREHEVVRALAEPGLLRAHSAPSGARRAARRRVTVSSSASSGASGSGSAKRAATLSIPQYSCEMFSVPSCETTGWLRRASAITSLG